MSQAPYLPPKTAAKLAEPAVNGHRHQQAKEIAHSLIGNGFAPEAVFAQLRAKYPPDVTDAELNGIVRWSANANPSPAGFGDTRPRHTFPAYSPTVKTAVKPVLAPKEHASWWLSGLELNPEKFSEASPIAIPESDSQAAILMFELIYGQDEYVNIVCQFIKDGDKANPKGSGKCLNRQDWIAWFLEKGIPQSEAGAWVRPNPCVPIGSGAGGAFTDADTEAHRFVLLESDVLPLPVQFALYSKLKIPISVVVSSGGKSIHAWARIDASGPDQYREMTKRILTALSPFGIDQANKNSSRLSRLAGAKRTIGADGDGRQRLLWLNPKPAKMDEAQLIALEESLLLPAIEERPLKRIARKAIGRYEELIANRGKLGVPTGIAQFDRDSGGLKAGTFVVIAAETGGGKSTLALNFIHSALEQKIGVGLFSLEMDEDEIMDAITSLVCRVNRNIFNTGNINEGEISKITGSMGKIGNYPLWIYDSPSLTVDDVRRAVLQLTGEKKIGMAVVDYVQLLTCNEFPASREQQIAAISRGLRSLAKEAKIPVIGLSQLNDEGKLRESRVLAHEAHIVFMLEELEQKPRLRVVKGRRIRKGIYDLRFDAATGRIEGEYAVHPNDVPHPPAQDTHCRPMRLRL